MKRAAGLAKGAKLAFVASLTPVDITMQVTASRDTPAALVFTVCAVVGRGLDDYDDDGCLFPRNYLEHRITFSAPCGS